MPYRRRQVEASSAALAAVQARLDDVVKGRNYASAAATGALGELDRLLELAEPETDLEAAQVVGLMYFFRFLALSDPDERARSFVQSLSLLRLVCKAVPFAMLPDPVVEIFREKRALLADDWHRALASDAERLVHSNVADLGELSIAITMQRKAADMLPCGSLLRLEYSPTSGCSGG